MFQTCLNIAKNSLKRKNFFVMAGKVAGRLHPANQNVSKQKSLSWCAEHAKPYEVYLSALDYDLWEETLDVCNQIELRGAQKLKALGIDLGGGGNYPLLYFLTRYMKAETVVETGVAAGWSSQAILSALAKNGGGGRLYSSDFPYFRQKNPEALSGFIVDEALRENWSLLLDGDQNNIPRIIQAIKKIDIFHYDSDKNYNGRDFCLKKILPLCHEKSIILFDDIQDNTHFKDYVEREGKAFEVFEFKGKYLGLTGNL